MSRHQNFRNYDYENELDDYDGVEEDDDMTAEDKALLAESAAQVKQALGDNASKIPKDGIEEAVYHYYFDADKALAYLIKTYVNPPPPAPAKQAPKAKPKQASHDIQGSRMSHHPPPCTAGTSFASFFHDMPWLNVPRSRQTTFIAPLLPRGGLLGGASAAPKMSKLQALAAQRKRKAEEAKKSKAGASAEGTAVESKAEDHPSKSAKLAIRTSPQEDLRAAKGPAPVEPEVSVPETAVVEGPAPMEGVCVQVQEQMTTELVMVAEPSAFVQALFGPKRKHTRCSAEEDFLTVPSLARAPDEALEAFSGPSPDDVILAAQAKGWKRSQAMH